MTTAGRPADDSALRAHQAPCRGSTLHAMDRDPQRSWTTVGLVVAACALVAGGVLVVLALTNSTAASSAPLLSPTAASTLGFPIVLQPAKITRLKSEGGCTSSDQSVYEDSTKKTALISDTVNCDSAKAASTALDKLRQRAGVDRSLPVPAALGATAFAVSSEAPHYLMVWQAGDTVAIAAIDVAIPGAITTKVTASPPLTQAQQATLAEAAKSRTPCIPTTTDRRATELELTPGSGC